MRFREYKNKILTDLHRYFAATNVTAFLRGLCLLPGYKYTFWMRTAYYSKQNGILFMPLYVMSRLMMNRYQYKYGICIPYNTRIGEGLYIGHFGGIFVNHEVKIGKNCNINQDVSIGATYGGKYPGIPVIGDNVYLGPGSKIIGGITLGNNVAVGANCVVNIDVPDNGVVIGNPCKIISYQGSKEYIVNTDY
ncbi:MAG: serine acetyltransferase [Syntrophaceae bacterium]|nr:serine acetyltransferase [Syntrophaceae bacterium]